MSGNRAQVVAYAVVCLSGLGFLAFKMVVWYYRYGV